MGAFPPVDVVGVTITDLFPVVGGVVAVAVGVSPGVTVGVSPGVALGVAPGVTVTSSSIGVVVGVSPGASGVIGVTCVVSTVVGVSPGVVVGVSPGVSVVVLVASVVGVAPALCCDDGASRVHWIVRLLVSAGVSVPCPEFETSQGGIVQQNDCEPSVIGYCTPFDVAPLVGLPVQG
jgi:hypothetical protein